MAYSTVLRSELQQSDVVIWFGVYQGQEAWLEFMLNTCSTYGDVMAPPTTKTIILGVLRDGIFQCVTE